MITNIDGAEPIKELDSKLPDYWNYYFDYKNDTELYEITKNELLKEVEKIKSSTKHYIDSKILVSNVLNKLGQTHTFHRQFNERFPNSHKEQVLGMQLYVIMIEEPDIWTYYETKHAGHLYSNATYFK